MGPFTDFYAVKEKIIQFSEKNSLPIQSFGPNKQIMEQELQWDGVLVLLEGQVEILQWDEEGKKNIASYLEGLQFLGLIEFLTGQKELLSTVRSTTRGNFVFLTGRVLSDFLSDPEFSSYLLYYLAELNRSNMSQRSKERLLSKKERLMDFFLEASFEKKLPFTIHQKKQDLSDLFQIPPRTLYRYLKEMEEKGWIFRKGNHILIGKKERNLLEKARNISAKK